MGKSHLMCVGITALVVLVFASKIRMLPLISKLPSL